VRDLNALNLRRQTFPSKGMGKAFEPERSSMRQYDAQKNSFGEKVRLSACSAPL